MNDVLTLQLRAAPDGTLVAPADPPWPDGARRLSEDETPACLVIVVARPTPPEITANLTGPLVLNSRPMMGRQVVLDGHKYPLRYRIPG